MRVTEDSMSRKDKLNVTKKETALTIRKNKLILFHNFLHADLK